MANARAPRGSTAGVGTPSAPIVPLNSDLSRASTRLGAREQNASLDFAIDDADAEARFERWRAADPFPDVRSALLNSADIADYVAATGMLTPFHPGRLKSASYEVALLGEYVIQDPASSLPTRGILKEGDTFVLPKNSIAFLTVEPYFRLPDYIALRHNLKIDHVYKGLLVGTGPLIDPGFVGRIALPLHNLTESDYEFRGGDGAIWVEFTKLSTRPEWKQSQQEHRAQYVTFPSEKSRTKTVENYIGDATRLQAVPASSSARIAQDAADAVSTANNAQRATRIFSIAGVAALLALAVGIFTMLIPLVFEVADLKTQIGNLISTSAPSPGPSQVSSSPSPSP